MSAPVSLVRRSFLGGALVLAAGLASRSSFADVAALAGPIKKVVQDTRGVTVTLDLDSAPFPTSAGTGYRDGTVIVFIPWHHRVGRDGAVSVVTHFHGHNTTAEKALLAHQLREQLDDSRQNAILVVPQLAVNAADSSCGKLEVQGGLSRLLASVLSAISAKEVSNVASHAAIPVGATVAHVCVSAHSGGFHAAACALKVGGVSVREVFLFDALYADSDAFKDWVIAGKTGTRHKLVSYFTDGGHTAANTRALFTQLEQAGVTCAKEEVEGSLSREEITRADAVSIKTALAHGAVTCELNGLRDCLYASTLHRRLRSSWFDAKKGKRPLERRR